METVIKHQCLGITKFGTRCKHMTIYDYCPPHKKKSKKEKIIRKDCLYCHQYFTHLKEPEVSDSSMFCTMCGRKILDK